MEGNGEGDVDECAGVKLVATAASMSSVMDSSTHTGDKCINGREDIGFCQTDIETSPWLALDYGSEVKVSSVVLINKNGTGTSWTKNVNIRVSSTPPVSGSEMFTGGQLLGTFEGPGTPGQRIEVTGGTELTGRYVVVQMDLSSEAGRLNLKEVTAWGKGKIFAV